MSEETISREGNILIRRLLLEAGAATRWHVDPYRRISIVARGEQLRIEHREGEGEPEEVEVAPGLRGWDEPADRVHRAVNAGASPDEEVTVFFLDAPEADPQPPGGQG